MPKSHIAIFASGNGTNAEEIIKHFKEHPTVEVSVVLSNNPEAYVLQRAKKFNIPGYSFNREQFKNPVHTLELLSRHDVTHIVLAGFLWLIPDYLLKAFTGKIINIHPALLPRYGGKGMYGMKVHEAVRTSGDHETGITIHEVNDLYDDGKIIFQRKCTVSKEDSPEQIAEKVHQLEYAFYPKVIDEWIKKK